MRKKAIRLAESASLRVYSAERGDTTLRSDFKGSVQHSGGNLAQASGGACLPPADRICGSSEQSRPFARISQKR